MARPNSKKAESYRLVQWFKNIVSFFKAQYRGLVQRAKNVALFFDRNLPGSFIMATMTAGGAFAAGFALPIVAGAAAVALLGTEALLFVDRKNAKRLHQKSLELIFSPSEDEISDDDATSNDLPTYDEKALEEEDKDKAKSIVQAGENSVISWCAWMASGYHYPKTFIPFTEAFRNFKVGQHEQRAVQESATPKL